MGGGRAGRWTPAVVHGLQPGSSALLCCCSDWLTKAVLPAGSTPTSGLPSLPNPTHPLLCRPRPGPGAWPRARPLRRTASGPHRGAAPGTVKAAAAVGGAWSACQDSLRGGSCLSGIHAACKLKRLRTHTQPPPSPQPPAPPAGGHTLGRGPPTAAKMPAAGCAAHSTSSRSDSSLSWSPPAAASIMVSSSTASASSPPPAAAPRAAAPRPLRRPSALRARLRPLAGGESASSSPAAAVAGLVAAVVVSVLAVVALDA